MSSEAKSRAVLALVATLRSCYRIGSKAALCSILLWVVGSQLFAAGQNGAPLGFVTMPEDLPVPVTATSPTREGLIHLDVRICDQTGRAVGDVTQSDVHLLDNGSPQEILSLRPSNDADVNERLNEVAFVLDDIDVPDRLIGQVREGLITYLQQQGHLTQPTAIYQMTDSGMHLLAEPSQDGHAQAASVMALAPVEERRNSKPIDKWNSALGAIYSLAVAWREEPGLKALVWLGPSWPVEGLVPNSARDAYFDHLVELESRILEARMAIYQVSLHSALSLAELGDPDSAKGVHTSSQMGHSLQHFSLPALSAQSGGFVRSGGDSVARDIERIVQDASTFYTLSFDPHWTERIDEFHDLKVEVSSSGDVARTTSGYYDQPVLYDQPDIAKHRVTVQKLQSFLQSSFGENDGELNRQLSSMELTERLNSGSLAQWLSKLHGKRSKEALTVLADRSVYLKPPASETSTDPPPDLATQALILKRTVQYLVQVLPTLPDFNATRTLSEYDEHEAENGSWKTARLDRSLREGITEKATLFYRNGAEEQVVHKRKGKTGSGKDLSFVGIFGPILHRVLHDAGLTPNGLAWSRWEHSSQGNEAVFQYTVHMKDPSYEVASCCLRNGYVFQTRPDYHGELTIDPETGSVLRLTIESSPGWIVQANLTPVRPVEATGMILEYGPVRLGGRTFICPLRSVVMLRNRVVRWVGYWGRRCSVYGPYTTTMDDITFSDYHKFGSESRILPGFEMTDRGQARPK